MDEFKEIVSSNLAGAAYAPITNCLVVKFKNGTKYRYADVSPELYAEFEAQFDGEDGRSAGKFFAARIKSLPCEKVEE